jgi:hypothetical protein
MRVRCIAGQHEAAPREVRNQGFGFSICRGCGRDMVRTNREWRIVPRGFRVVWKHRPPQQTVISAAQLFFDLPSTGRSLVVPARPRRARPMGLLFLVMAALRWLGWAAAGRLGAWGRALRAARPAGLPPMQLAGAGARTATP